MPVNEKILDRKLNEYLFKSGAAMRIQDFPKAKKAAGMFVVLARLQARTYVCKMVALSDELRYNERAIKKMGQQGISFPLVKCRSERLRKQLREAKKLDNLISVRYDSGVN